ncbi:MAG: AAA family ATPase, partial [Sphingomonadales bacterium]
MQFNRIRLSGFKSFVDPTELFIEPGLTGIVGPNGCGKSNLLEALKWVMGENSAKRMRGEMMDDVIFSGTERRTARNLAEVTLLLDNSDRKAPARFNDSDELEVSRRIERDSGSAFRINGEEVRAKDVQLLFADAATGAHSPALVSQGKVSTFINAKPQERRLILEEAAGITGLHSRRKEAEQRLRAAENNLERLDDIMGQMEVQAGSLKRQARQATRYKNIAGHIRTTQAILLFLKWQNLENLTNEVGEKLRGVERQVAGKTSDVTALNSEVEKLQEGLNPLRQKEVEASAAFSRVRIELEGLENEERSIQARIEEFKSRLTQLDQDLTRETSFLGDSENTLKRQKDEQETLQKELQTDLENSNGIEEDYKGLATKTSEAEEHFNTLNSAKTGKKIRTQHLEADLEALKTRRERLKAEETAARQELSVLKPAEDGGVKSDRSKVDATLKTLKIEETEFSELETKRLAAQEKFEAARETYSEAKAGLGAMEGEIAALEAMLAEETPTGQVPIAKALRVEGGYETALSAALGDDLEATEGNEGNHTWHTLEALDNAPALPGGAKPLSDFIKGPAALSRRLSQVGIVEDGINLMKELLPGQRLVSLDGTLWRWDGLVRTSRAPTFEAIKILQKNKLKTLSTKKEAESIALSKLEAAFTSTGKALNALKEAEESKRTKVQEATETYKIERDKISEAEEENLKATQRAAALTEALGRLEKDIEEGRDKIVTLETEIEVLGQAGKEEQEFEVARNKLEDLRENLAK